MVRRVRTAVFPVAGLGTRFLPATKAMPKEMLTVVDKPLIQYAVDEAREAGIEHFVFVTGRNKGVIEDHFDRQFELEMTLESRGKKDALDQLRRELPKAGQSSFTRQQEPLGLGHAVWCARDIVGNEPFALLLPDMIFKASPGVLRQMMDAYEETGGNILGVEECEWDEVSSYGIVQRGEGPDTGFRIDGMVEKPKREDAPSNLFISGRYILQPEIFTLLSEQSAGAGGEIQITDAMQKLMSRQPFVGVKYDGRVFDCGSKIGFLTANVVFALEREDIADQFMAELKTLTGDIPISIEE
ncbi:UTP--glucose-1-phosphate uridylyltransferase GalU [Pelagibacterium luteolum]|uniref:UTP--glucose-1-phosphate uridylyltransferase n=1 Tax=Pelagibacterium luteolum TaxID=440168 RepID=A0A1G7WSG4_9HYPH|nr:UTP--glucose-1-phosphate uridylyltransferase GalU [Pelagibacterium luteolum]SDG74872.1 UTP--glucose-1-phosphate uridylyltransferase [Pelagibacterium luteolum]